MAYVVTLRGFRPSPRYDGLPWTQARIEESTTEAGTFTGLETFTLDPVDADPEQPQSRNLTTDQATLPVGWYRVVFIDAAGSEETSGAVLHGPGAGLTTLTAMRQFLQKQGGERTQDDVLQALITAASAEIQRRTRIIRPAETDVSRPFILPEDSRWLDLNPYFLRGTPTLVERDTDTDSPVELASTDYAVDPLPSDHGVYTHLRLARRSSKRRQVTVTGDWGYLSVPPDVEMWCQVTVNHWLKAEVSAFTRGFDVDAGRFTSPQALPEAVLDGLKDYRRTAVPAALFA